jgi:transposase
MLELTRTDYRQVRHLLDLAEARPDQLAKASPAVQVLDTMPGLGSRTAEAVAAHLHQPERFTTGKQVSAYCGLVRRIVRRPRVSQRVLRGPLASLCCRRDRRRKM